MLLSKKICCFLALFILISFAFSESMQVSALSLSAQSAILIEGYENKVIFEKNSQKIRSMASTTKIMTAVVALEHGELSEKVKIPKEATSIEGSSIYLCENEVLTLEQLIYALLLASANDAATAIALHIGKSIEGFANMMNKKAEEIGLLHTHFDNPHGLDSDSHYTTAEDLAILASYAIKIPKFKEIVSTYKTNIPFCNKENGRLLVNHNRLLRIYDGAIGVKTGFTKKSGRCLVSAAERNGVILIAVTLSASDDWNDHKAMLDYGFENYVTEKLSLPDAELLLPVISGEKSNLRCEQYLDLHVTLPKNHGAIICKIEMYPFTYAPVEKGEKLGKVTYYCDGQFCGESDIISSEQVPLKPQKYTISDRIADYFGK